MSMLSKINAVRRGLSVSGNASKTPMQSLGKVSRKAFGDTWPSPPEHALDNSCESILRAFASLPVDLALDHLQVDRTGLSDDEASLRLAVKGPNTLQSQKPPSWFILLLKVIPNAFNLLLVFLAIITIAMPDHDWVCTNTHAHRTLIPNRDTNLNGQIGFTVLMVMVAISVIVRFWQEYRSSLAVFRLQSTLATSARTRRQTFRDIPTSNLAPGDIITLSPGSVVPADCLILEASFLRISQSQWTGESSPASKMASSDGEKTDYSVFDLSSICLMGTGVVSGNATAVVIRTGREALVATMSSALNKKRDLNAFQRGIRGVTWVLIGFMCVMVPIVLVINAKTTGDWRNAALFSISVAVGLVPEMLPAIVNANLARGAYLLSKKKAIVRRLDSVQNLGAMTVLCSDKVRKTSSAVVARCANCLDGNFDEGRNYAAGCPELGSRF